MSRHQRYSAHAQFVSAAAPTAQVWRVIAGFLLVLICYTVLLGLMNSAVASAWNGRTIFGDDGQSAFGMFLILGSFGCMTLAVLLTVLVLHRRRFATLLGPLGPLVRDFRAVSVVLLVLVAVIIALPPWDMGAPYIPNVPFGRWTVLLLPGLVFIFIQISAEELLFRGYLQQQLGARFRSPLVWMVLPSLLFAIIHYDSTIGTQVALIVVVWAGVFGMMMSDLTARSGSLGPALAVHFWNNAFGMLLVSTPDELSGLALYMTPVGLDNPEDMLAWLPVDFALIVILWLGARLAIRR